MLRQFLSISTAALVAATLPATVRAQAGAALPYRLTLGGSFGGLSGAANLNDAGTSDWRLGWVGSFDGTVWVLQHVGLRASGSWAQDSIGGATLAGRGKFNKFAYDADLVLRYPVAAGSGTLSPYVLGGVGAVSVHELGADSTWSKFAGNVGVGLEYRFGRVGVRAEGRDFIYTFDRYGFNKTQHDIAWQGGITLAF